jgi:hypothetical protein
MTTAPIVPNGMAFELNEIIFVTTINGDRYSELLERSLRVERLNSTHSRLLLPEGPFIVFEDHVADRYTLVPGREYRDLTGEQPEAVILPFKRPVLTTESHP